MPGLTKPTSRGLVRANPHRSFQPKFAKAAADGICRWHARVRIDSAGKMPGDMRALHIARRAGCLQPPAGAPQRAAFLQNARLRPGVRPCFTANIRQKSLNRRHFVRLESSAGDGSSLPGTSRASFCWGAARSRQRSTVDVGARGTTERGNLQCGATTDESPLGG
jgi:hypothetical protein